MNRTIFLFLFIFLPLVSLAQSKKELLLELNGRIDSLNTVLNSERENSTRKTNELQTEINTLHNQINTIEQSNSQHTKYLQVVIDSLNEVNRVNTIKLKRPENKSDIDFNKQTYFYDGFIVLSPFADTNWSTGPAEYLTQSSATKLIDLNKLPAQYKNLIGQEYQLARGSKSIQKVKITGLKLYAGVIAHFGMVQDWEGNDEMDLSPLSLPERAESIFDIAAANGGLFLVATISDPLFLSEEDEISAAFPTNTKVNINNITLVPVNDPAFSTQKKIILSELANVFVYKDELQAEFMSSKDICWDTKNYLWWKHPEIDTKWKSYKMKNGTSYVILDHRLGEGCGCEVSASSIWKIEPGNSPVLQHIKTYGLGTIDATDYNGDSIPEFICVDGFTSYFRLVFENGFWNSVDNFDIPYLDCPC